MVSVEGILKKAAEDESKSIQLVSVDKQVDLSLDLAHLAAFDTNPIDVKAFRENKEEYLKNLTRDNTQLVMNQIWNLETQRNEDVVVAKLPKPTYSLPREKPIPKPKAPTKWEKYAAEKGIQKRKRDKLVWDEEAKEWKPRFGYKGINQKKNEWVIEVPQNGDPNADYFEKQAEEKKERIAKNELQRLRNIARNKKLRLPGTSGIAPNVDLNKDQIGKARSLAKLSTASLGKFVEKLADEKPDRKTGKKRQFRSNLDQLGEEKTHNLELAEKVLEQQKRPLDTSAEERAFQSVKKARRSRRSDDDDVETRGARSAPAKGRPVRGGRGGKVGRKTRR